MTQLMESLEKHKNKYNGSDLKLLLIHKNALECGFLKLNPFNIHLEALYQNDQNNKCE